MSRPSFIDFGRIFDVLVTGRSFRSLTTVASSLAHPIFAANSSPTYWHGRAGAFTPFPEIHPESTRLLFQLPEFLGHARRGPFVLLAIAFAFASLCSRIFTRAPPTTSSIASWCPSWCQDLT